MSEPQEPFPLGSSRLPRASLAALVLFVSTASAVAANPAGPLEPGFVGWKQVQTKHFVFVYEPRDQATVSEFVSFAEEVYDEVTAFVGARPPKVWVVVAGRIDTANGFTTPIPPHLVLYISPPSEPLIGLDASSYLRLLLAHELTHYVNFEYDKGLFADLSKVFGSAVKGANMTFLPVWFIEGIATFTETLFTDGGRGRNPFFEMEYRALVLEHKFFTLRQAAYSSSFPPLDRDWLGGYLVFHYLTERYGPDIYRRIHDEYVRFPLLGPAQAIERATGRGELALYRDMLGELDTELAGERLVPPGRRVSPPGVGDYYLPVITERGWYLYRDTLYREPAIVAYDPRTTRERVIFRTPLSDSVSLTASRDGSKLVFAAYETTEGRSGEILASDLYALDPASGRERRITLGAHVWQPRLSPDGARLVAVEGVGDSSRLVEVDERTGALKLLFSLGGATVSTPAFSPDGREVVFELEKRGEKGLYVLPLAGASRALSPDDPISAFNVQAARPLVPLSETGVYYPYFAGARRVVFSSDRDGSLALYTIGLDGADLKLVCRDPVGAWEGEIVGDRVLYASFRSEGYVLMEKKLQLEAGTAEMAGAPSGTLREGAAPTPPLQPGPYVDLPRFLAWAPLPIYYSSIASEELLLAPGAILGGLSNLGTTSYLAALSFRTDADQPALETSVQTELGTSEVGYALSEGYTILSPTDYLEELVQQAGASIPIVSSSLFDASTSLSLLAGVTDSLSQTGSAPFSFSEGFGAPGLAFEHDFSVDTGLSFERTTQGSSFDLFAPWEVLASAAVSVYPPGLSESGLGAVASGLASLAFPSPIPHEVVKLGVKASYVTFPGPFYELTTPRGAFNPVLQDLPGRALVALDYEFPIALLDSPIAYSVGLAGIGAGVHLEAAGDWGGSPDSFVPDQDLYAGAEVVLNLATGETSFPIGLGLSVQFDPRFATPFDPATDLRPYIFLSTDSFSGTLYGLLSPDKAPVLMRP